MALPPVCGGIGGETVTTGFGGGGSTTRLRSQWPGTYLPFHHRSARLHYVRRVGLSEIRGSRDTISRAGAAHRYLTRTLSLRPSGCQVGAELLKQVLMLHAAAPVPARS